ncbi:uncharacterized protein LOC129770174 [Toxorhynchites rutilus septentrionalis]|uniref:uncharacterized protein LOC129770174 n=1 Tax=Toxorhynchites rutilus septentrionalis TaxID=329112 RepID=UPI002478777B|nr:uncharacterized protein LOC129770174 [Toxorhynchites rutilus septentrionalis]
MSPAKQPVKTMTASVLHWSSVWILVCSLVAAESQFTEQQVEELSFVYHKKPGTSNMVDCDTNGMMCKAQEKYCGAFHIGNNYFVTGAHCLVATDGNIRNPYELDILGVGPTEVQFVMHKDYGQRTGNDVAWIKTMKPIGVKHYALVAEIRPWMCRNFALEVHNPSAQGLRSGFRWIAEVYEQKFTYVVTNMRPGSRTIRYNDQHTNTEIVTFCNTQEDLNKQELHYIFMGFRDRELFQMDCHVAKCSHISFEDLHVPPVVDIDITTVPVTTEDIVISNSERNEPDVGSSGTDSASSGSDSDKSGSSSVDRNQNLVTTDREFFYSDSGIVGSRQPDNTIQGPTHSLSGPNYTISHPNYAISHPKYIIPHPSYEKSAPFPDRLGPKDFVNKDLEYVNSEPDSSNSDPINSDSNLSNPSTISVNLAPDLDRASPDYMKRGLNFVQPLPTYNISGPDFEESLPDFENKDLEYIHSEPDSGNSGSNDVEDLNYVQTDPESVDAPPGIVDSDSNSVSSDVAPDDKEPSKDELTREFSADDSVSDLSMVPPKEAEVDGFDDTIEDDGDRDDDDGGDFSPVEAAPQRVAVVSGFKTRSPVRIDHFSMTTEQPWLQLWKQRMSSYFVKNTPEAASSAGYKPPEEKSIIQPIRQFATKVRPTATHKPLMRSYEKVPISPEIVVDIHSSDENEEGYKEDVIRITNENITNIPPVIPDMRNSPTDLPDVLDQNFDDEPNLDKQNKDEVDMRELTGGFEWPPTFSDRDGLEPFDVRVFSDRSRAHYGTNFTPNVVPCDCTHDEVVQRTRTVFYKITKNKRPNRTTGGDMTKRTGVSASAKNCRLYVKFIVAVAITMANV